MDLIVVFPCIFDNYRVFDQQMHFLLDHKILQCLFKIHFLSLLLHVIFYDLIKSAFVGRTLYNCNGCFSVSLISLRSTHLVNIARQTTWTQTAFKLLYCPREFQFICTKHAHNPIAVSALSKVWVCVRSLAGFAGSNPAGSMDVCHLWVLGVVRQGSLRRADPSSRGVPPSVVCLSVIVNPR